MHDAERLAVVVALLVRVVQTGRRGRHDRAHVLERHVRLAFADCRSSFRSVLAVDVLHREEVLAVRLADVVTPARCCWWCRPRREPRLVEEHRDEALVSRVLGADPLEHDVPLEALDPVGAAEQDLGHAARREMFENADSDRARLPRRAS